jgi:hypothetical protein
MMLAVMFGAFLVTIVFRYVLNWPAGWASELSTVMWIWLVLWGAAFVLREREEIRFDIFYGSGRAGGAPGHDAGDLRLAVILSSCSRCRRSGTTSPSWKVQRTAYLRIRYDWLFSIYVVFAVAIVVRYGWLIVRAVQGHDPLPPEQAAPADLQRD